ncbi:MAG: VWA domain-containing protein, partial [Gammaproteobacteria bacterium]
MPEQFHFIQPLWLLALLPLAFLLWQVSQHSSTNNPWRKVVDSRLLPLLMRDQRTGNRQFPLWLLASGWLLTVLALADPAWEQQPQPVMQTTTSRVIVLDLSRSMLAADLQPSRLLRARFKVEDILARADESQTGLVVFAGAAFSVTPLTRDADTLRAQLKALEPDIMPAQGSRADLGLLKAQELLQQAGAE